MLAILASIIFVEATVLIHCYYVASTLDLHDTSNIVRLFIEYELESGIIETIILLSVICLVVFFLFLKPLLNIKARLHEAIDNPDQPSKYPLSYPYKNELGDIVDDINQLLQCQQHHMDLLAQKQQELDSLNKNLESIVQQRTEALEAANTQLQNEIVKRELAEKNTLLPEESPNPIIKVSSEGTIVYKNKVAEELHLEGTIPELWREAITQNKAFIEWQKEDEIYLVNIVPDDEGNISLYAVDITLHKQQQDKIQQMTNYDAATTLPNRILFNDLSQQLVHWSHETNEKIALVAISICDDGSVTKFLGHEGKEKLLRAVAVQLKERAPEKSVVGYLGDNEFILTVGAVSDLSYLDHQLEVIKSELNQEYTVNNRVINVKFLFGVSLSPDDGKDLVRLISNASTAVYFADKSHPICYFNETMAQKMGRRHQLLAALPMAIERNQLALHYQPQYNLTTQTITGCEVLLRWHHPELGDISPADFIPLAEESGDIIKITQWVLSEVAKQSKRNNNVVYAVNISMLDLTTDSLSKHLKNLIQTSQLNAKNLELEVTETALSHNIIEAQDKLQQLKQLGIAIAIDDFGTGYCSMQYLKDFPVDKLKIDRAFVKGVELSSPSQAIISSIIHLAQGLELKLLAEGVETAEQATLLRNLGCDTIQGYYYSKPIGQGDFEKLLDVG